MRNLFIVAVVALLLWYWWSSTPVTPSASTANLGTGNGTPVDPASRLSLLFHDPAAFFRSDVSGGDETYKPQIHTELRSVLLGYSPYVHGIESAYRSNQADVFSSGGIGNAPTNGGGPGGGLAGSLTEIVAGLFTPKHI